MPGQRKKGKRNIGAWVDERFYAALKKRAEDLGISVSDLIIASIKEGLDDEQKKTRR